jgi:tetratricopeptide (TPR) repeat protein
MKERCKIFAKTGDIVSQVQGYNEIGLTFLSNKQFDSAMFYLQYSLKLAETTGDDSLILYPMSSIGEVHLEMGNYDLGLPYIRRVLAYPPWFNDAECHRWMYNDLAQAFLGTGQFDSAVYYSSETVRLCYQPELSEINGQLLRAYKYLYAGYDALHQIDSSNKYFRLATVLKDSLFDIDKIKAVQAVTLREQMYKLELESQAELSKQEALKERRVTIEYSALGIGIITLLILGLMLSQSIAVKPKLVKTFGIVGLLITFEFLNLLLHPFLGDITHHSPALMLLCMVVVAALLVPLHHKLQHWITTKLVARSERNRIEAAKKIIAEAEEAASN